MSRRETGTDTSGKPTSLILLQASWKRKRDLAVELVELVVAIALE